MATFTNQATLSYNDNVRNSNIVTGEILDALTVTKTAIEPNYAAGDTVTYVININNSSAADYNNLTVTDNLGTYTTGDPAVEATPLTYIGDTVTVFVNGVLQPAGAAVTGTNPLTLTGINVPAGGNATVIYAARANEFAPLNPADTIRNAVAVSGAGLADDITAEAVLPVNAEPNLSITKAVNPATVTGNGPLTYTFVISNEGNTAATADDDIMLTDTFDPRLNITGVSLNGTALTENTDYTYDPTTGLFTTTSGAITVPAAQYTQDNATGAVAITPGTSTLTVTGTIL